MRGPHINEDGRCSWCDWGGPDWAECETYAWHWGSSQHDVYWMLWSQHLDGHARRPESAPPELDAGDVMRQVRALLWLHQMEVAR